MSTASKQSQLHTLGTLPASASFIQIVIRTLLHLVPKKCKPLLYELIAKLSHQPYHGIFRLPFGLVLKVVSTDKQAVEANALRFVGSLRGINVPTFIDYAATAEKSYLLSTWIDGERCTSVWKKLTTKDKDMIVAQLKSLVRWMQKQTVTSRHVICNASGGPITDPRVPWLDEDPRVFTSCREFLEEVWPGVDRPRNKGLQSLICPLIERDDIPIVFCHGDILPRNIILPGGLESWRSGNTTLGLVDWEYSGWVPMPWEALKATWLVVEPDDEWLPLMKLVFPEARAELEADWEWRSRSGIPIV